MTRNRKLGLVAAMASLALAVVSFWTRTHTGHVIAVLPVAVLLAACASNPQLDPNYAAYVAASQATAAAQPKTPLVRITAQPGQTIEMRGVASFEVYSASGGNSAVAIAPYQPTRNEYLPLVQTGLSLVGHWLGLHELQRGAVGIANAVGNAATRGYPYVQAPAGTTITGSYNQDRHDVVDRHDSIVDRHDTTTITTTLTDRHDVTDNHTITPAPVVVQPAVITPVVLPTGGAATTTAPTSTLPTGLDFGPLPPQ